MNKKMNMVIQMTNEVAYTVGGVILSEFVEKLNNTDGWVHIHAENDYRILNVSHVVSIRFYEQDEEE